MTSSQGDVGVAGTQYLATTTPPSGAITTIKKLADDNQNAGIIEIARFYQDPVSGQTVTFDGSSTLGGQLDYIKSSALGGTANSNSTLYLTVYDYDPATGAAVQIAQSVKTDTGAPTPPVTLTGATPTGSLQKGHRLRIVMGVDMSAGKITTIELRTNSLNSYTQICAPTPANLILDKSVNTTSLAATGSGRTLTYTLNYANASAQTAATNATLVDTLPTGVAFASATLNGNPITPAGTNPYTFALGTVAAGGSGTLTISANVADNLSNSLLTNSATLASDQTLGITAIATTAVTGAVNNPAGTSNVIVSKQADKTLIGAGGTVTYTLTAVNAGDKSASSVTVSDDFPDQDWFSYGSCTTATGSCGASAGVLTWNMGTLLPGQVATLTFTMNAASSGVPPGITPLANTAGANWDSGSATSNTVMVSISTQPNLTLSKSVTDINGGAIEPGDALTYTLTVTNTGSGGASNVVVSDPIPSNTLYSGPLSAPGGWAGSFDAVDNRVLFTTPTLAPGATAVMSFQVTVDSLQAGATLVNNSASVSAGNAASRQATTLSTATARPLLSITKIGPAAVPFPGATLATDADNTSQITVTTAAPFGIGLAIQVGTTITRITAIAGNTLSLSSPVTASAGTPVTGGVLYLIAYQNTGNAAVSNVAVSDPLPDGWVFASASPSPTVAPAVGSGGTVTWTLPTRAAGESGAVSVMAIPTAPGSVANTATLTDTHYCAGATPPAGCSSTATHQDH